MNILSRFFISFLLPMAIFLVSMFGLALLLASPPVSSQISKLITKYPERETVIVKKISSYVINKTSKREFLATLDKFDISYKKREIDHLNDVGNVFKAVTFIFIGSLFYLFLSAIYLIKRGERLFREVFMLALKRTMIAEVFTGILAIIFFSTFFQLFHELLFASNSWIFSSDSFLIIYFPFNFWLLSFSLLVSVSIILTGLPYAILLKMKDKLIS